MVTNSPNPSNIAQGGSPIGEPLPTGLTPGVMPGNLQGRQVGEITDGLDATSGKISDLTPSIVPELKTTPSERVVSRTSLIADAVPDLDLGKPASRITISPNTPPTATAVIDTDLGKPASKITISPNTPPTATAAIDADLGKPEIKITMSPNTPPIATAAIDADLGKPEIKITMSPNTPPTATAAIDADLGKPEIKITMSPNTPPTAPVALLKVRVAVDRFLASVGAKPNGLCQSASVRGLERLPRLTTLKHEPERQAALIRPQGAEAIKTALCVNFALLAAAKEIMGSVMSKMMPEKLPEAQFKALLETYRTVLKEANLKNPDDCKLLKDLLGLLNKGFRNGVGGFQEDFKKIEVTDFQYSQGTDITWGEAGFTAEEMNQVLERKSPGENDLQDCKKKLTAKDIEAMTKPENSKSIPDASERIAKCLENKNKLESVNNEKAKEQFGKMLTFLENHYQDHLNVNKRHPVGVTSTEVQLLAVFGQLINDVLPIDTHKILQKAMAKSGLIDPEALPKINELKNKMRQNLLLTEASNKTIKTEIKNAFHNSNKKYEMHTFLSNNWTFAKLPEFRLTQARERSLLHFVFYVLL